MPFAEYQVPGPLFAATNTNKLNARRTGLATCDPCLTPNGMIPNGCRTKWTPEPTLLWQSTLNGWTGDAAVARTAMGTIQGNDVLSGNPWQLTTVGNGLGFSQPSEASGPLVYGADFDAFTVGAMPVLPWLFTGDPETSCVDSVATSYPTSTNEVVKENTTDVPADLTDADIQALGADNSWPTFGSADIYGPVISFSYTETFDAQATLTIANGQHRLSFVLGVNVEARQNVRVARLQVTGSYPNRVGVFSRSVPAVTDTGVDAYSLDFDWRWESAVRPTTFYTDNQVQIETLTETASFSGKGWTETGGRHGYSGALGTLPTPLSDSLVTLPVFTDITWRRFS